MITNELRYRTTAAQLVRFERALANLQQRAGTGPRSTLAQRKIDAVASRVDELRAELAEFDRLRSGTVSSFEASSLKELPTLLIKARIARGWTQRHLAETLGVAEQQIQRYESTGYRSASLGRICKIAAALGVTITEKAELSFPSPSVDDPCPMPSSDQLRAG